MTTTPTPSSSMVPATLRQADWFVLALVIITLLTTWFLRQQALTSSEQFNLGGVQVSLPSGSMAAPNAGQFAVVTPNGLTVSVNEAPAPPVGTEGIQALAVNRALQQGKALTLYRVIANTPTTVNNTPAAVLDYAYVQDSANPLSTTGLIVIRGREILVGRANQVSIVSLEAPEAQWLDVQTLWPQLLQSITLANS